MIFKAQLREVFTAEDREPDICLGFTWRILKGMDRRGTTLEYKAAK